MPWGLNDAMVVVDGPACEGWSAIVGQLTVAHCCISAVLSTTIADEAKWDWWWEVGATLGFLPFFLSCLFFEEEGPASLDTDEESAPFCLLLHLYKENSVHGENFAEPPPELVEGEEVYEVETILNHRKQGWGYQYFVKWQGYPISDASWEPEHVFSDDGNMLTQYKLRHSLWPQAIPMLCLLLTNKST